MIMQNVEVNIKIGIILVSFTEKKLSLPNHCEGSLLVPMLHRK